MVGQARAASQTLPWWVHSFHFDRADERGALAASVALETLKCAPADSVEQRFQWCGNEDTRRRSRKRFAVFEL